MSASKTITTICDILDGASKRIVQQTHMKDSKINYTINEHQFKRLQYLLKALRTELDTERAGYLLELSDLRSKARMFKADNSPMEEPLAIRDLW
jgi:hypothetical protein